MLKSNDSLDCAKAMSCDDQKAYAFNGLAERTLGERMERVTLVRVVAGVLAVIVFVTLMFRLKGKARSN